MEGLVHALEKTKCAFIKNENDECCISKFF
jgi:hypothetical protein